MVSIRSLAAIVVGLALGLGAPSVASACSVPSPPPLPPGSPPVSPLKGWDVGVYGVVSSVRYLPDTDPLTGKPSTRNRDYEATVRVTRVFKGAVRQTVRIRGNTAESDCGFGKVTPGQRLALRLDKPPRPYYYVGVRSGISLDDLLEATAGRWHRPPKR